MKIKFTLIVVVLAMVLAACGTEAAPAPEPQMEEVVEAPAEEAVAVEEPVEEVAMPKSIVDSAVEDGRFTTLVAAVQAAGRPDLTDPRPGAPGRDGDGALRQGRRRRRFGGRQGRRGFLLVLPPHGEHAQQEHGADEHDLAGARSEKIAVEFHGRGTMTENFSRTERLARPAEPPAMTR